MWERGHVQKKVIDLWELCFHDSCCLKYFWFYLIDLNIILIYPHITSHLHLLVFKASPGMWVLDKPSISTPWLSLSCLPFFWENCTAGSEDGTKPHPSSTTTSSLSASLVTLCFFPSLLQGHFWSLSLRGNVNRQTKQKTKEGRMWVPGFFAGLDPPHLPSQPMGSYFGHREGLRNLVFLKKGMNNHQTKNQRLWKLQGLWLWND